MAGVNSDHKICATCGSVFSRPHCGGLSEWSNRKFCSTNCYHASRKGERSRNWKGGKKKTVHGYIERYVPSHPHADKNGYVKEHVLVMTDHIGRSLHADEVVHHKNEDKTDNRLENLELLSKSRHMKHHMRGKIFSATHRQKISASKKEMSHLIQRNQHGQFIGGVKYGE